MGHERVLMSLGATLLHSGGSLGVSKASILSHGLRCCIILTVLHAVYL